MIGMQCRFIHLMVMMAVAQVVAMAQVQHGYDLTIAVISNNRLDSLKVQTQYRIQNTQYTASLFMRARMYHAPRTMHHTPCTTRAHGRTILLTVTLTLTLPPLRPLQRLGMSLSAMRNPDGLQVHLVFNLEASSSRELIDYAYTFPWSMGTKLVRKRLIQGGLIPAVVESWFPSGDNNYGLFLEDDIEVSPFALMWVQQTLGLVRGGALHIMFCATAV